MTKQKTIFFAILFIASNLAYSSSRPEPTFRVKSSKIINFFKKEEVPSKWKEFFKQLASNGNEKAIQLLESAHWDSLQAEKPINFLFLDSVLRVTPENKTVLLEFFSTVSFQERALLKLASSFEGFLLARAEVHLNPVFTPSKAVVSEAAKKSDNRRKREQIARSATKNRINSRVGTKWTISPPRHPVPANVRTAPANVRTAPASVRKKPIIIKWTISPPRPHRSNTPSIETRENKSPTHLKMIGKTQVLDF